MQLRQKFSVNNFVTTFNFIEKMEKLEIQTFRKHNKTLNNENNFYYLKQEEIEKLI